jgi:hypothetical protein
LPDGLLLAPALSAESSVTVGRTVSFVKVQRWPCQACG